MSNLLQRPFSIKIFLPTGDPEGLRIIEKSNWTGIGIYFKRPNFQAASQRPEFNKTGVYILIGNADDSSLPTLYIGEGDPVGPRLTSHQSTKDFWAWAIFFTAKDNSLNKAHIKHLESRLLTLALTAKQSHLDNVQTSLPPNLSEADAADAESFLLDILSIFPLLGLTAFEQIQSPQQPSNLLTLDRSNLKATGYEDPKGFVVCKGAIASSTEKPSIHPYLTTLRQDLIQQGILTAKDNQTLKFTQDYAFSSPSTAAGVILGYPANGRIEWKDPQGKTLKDIQTTAIPPAPS
jgi:hypothetical protein